MALGTGAVVWPGPFTVLLLFIFLSRPGFRKQLVCPRRLAAACCRRASPKDRLRSIIVRMIIDLTLRFAGVALNMNMGDVTDINLGDSTVEPTDEQLAYIGRKFKEAILPLPRGTVLPRLQPTDPAVWKEKMAKAMAAAKKSYAAITRSDIGDVGRP